MLVASVFSHIALGALLSLVFTLYYINGDGKWKLFLEIIIGAGGNVGAFFLLDNWIKPNNIVIRMYSIGSCIMSFLVVTFVLLIIFSYIIKDKDDKDIIRLRDIMLGQTAWINKYYEKRSKEIDSKLNIPALERKAEELSKREDSIIQKESYIKEEREKLSQLTNKKLRINLPENADIVLNKEYIDSMPAYLSDIIRCINNLEACTDMVLKKAKEEVGITSIKSYFVSLATYISSDLFGGNTPNVRVHFRLYDPEKNGYIKLVAVVGRKIVNKDLTFIPYDDDNMIKKSYECRRALIRSINSDHDYKSNNYSMWEDYLTYTFYDINYGDIPILSFGISIKNAVRYRKILHFLNYFRIEDFLQHNIEQVDELVNLSEIFYGGSKHD